MALVYRQANKFIFCESDTSLPKNAVTDLLLPLVALEEIDLVRRHIVDGTIGAILVDTCIFTPIRQVDLVVGNFHTERLDLAQAFAY